MKFQINSKTLFESISVVRRVQSSKNAIPILECMLFDIKDNTLTLACSDSEMHIIATLPLIESDSDFSVAIPTADLLLKNLSDQPITFECLNNPAGGCSVEIYYLNGHLTLMGLSGLEFPSPCKPVDAPQTITIPMEYMSDGIRHTKFAASDDVTLKPQMAGVYFDMQPYGMISVASDGNRLAKVWYKDVRTYQPFGFTMSNKAVKCLSEIFSKVTDAETAQLVYSGLLYCVTAGQFSLYGRLPEQKYPNYNSVIPQSYDAIAEVSRLDIIAAISRVGMFADFKNEVSIYFTNGNMSLESGDMASSRSAEENVLCDYKGNPMRISVEYRFLYEILNTIDDEETILIGLISPTSPLVITPKQQLDDQDVMYLLMPMAPQQY